MRSLPCRAFRLGAAAGFDDAEGAEVQRPGNGSTVRAGARHVDTVRGTRCGPRFDAEANRVRDPSVFLMIAFGGHVRRCPLHFAGDRPRRAGVFTGQSRDTEVEELVLRHSALPNGHGIGGL